MLAQLVETHPDDVRVVYRHFPLLSIHDKAALATQASEAAGRQDQFWVMHDLLFERQAEWSEMSVVEFETWLAEQAGALGLDLDQFKSDLKDPELATLAQKAWDDGVAAGLPGTPFLLINGRYYQGPRDITSLESIIKLIQMEDRQFTECPPMTVDPKKEYTATIQTEKGDIVVRLFPDVAAMAVNSFIFLAQNSWFDGVTFHRVIPDFVAQTGDPSGSGMGGPGYTFSNEISPNLKFEREGLLGMANAGPDSNGSQWFITLGPAPHLDGGYTIFGEVISGMEVAQSLTPRDPQQNPGAPPGDQIVTVTVEEK